MEIDHIVPVKLGGKTEFNNLQILCKTCNLAKGTQMISFLNNKTPLDKPMEFRTLNSNPNPNENVDCCVKRVINFFYRCDAVSEIEFHQRKSGKYYFEWAIHLHEGNPVEWILLYKNQIVEYINNNLG